MIASAAAALGLDRRQLRLLGMAGLAMLLASFDGSVLSLALPAIAAEFRASIPALSNLGAVLALGSLGALPLAMLADRAGRRRLIAVGVAGFAVANALSAFAPDLRGLAACRLLAACFEALVASVATALVVEEVPAGSRGLAVAMLIVMAGAGTLLTIVAYPLLAPRWRLLYLAGGLALPLAGVLWLRLPEGRTWAASSRAAGRRTLALLLEPPWRPRLLVLAASAGLGALLYEPAGLFVALFGSQELRLRPLQISEVVFVSGFFSIPAFLLGGRLSDRFGRRRLGAGISAATALAAGFTFAGSLGGYWAGSVLWSVLASSSVPVLGAWFGELFPTRARATSEAVGALAGAVGGALGLQLIAALEPVLGLGPALLVVAAGALGGAGLLLLLPESGGRPLPD